MRQPRFHWWLVVLAPLLVWGSPSFVAPLSVPLSIGSDAEIDAPVGPALDEIDAATPGTERPPTQGQPPGSRSARASSVATAHQGPAGHSSTSGSRAWPGLLGLNAVPAIPPPTPSFAVTRS